MLSQLRLRVLFSLLLSGAVTLLLSPPVRALAVKLGAVDRPDGARRVNACPVPRLGGAAMFLGFLSAALCFSGLPREIGGVLLGSFIIVLLGAADDVLDLPPGAKLLGQLASALIAAASGVVIRAITDPRASGGVVELGSLSVPVTLLWIVGITNALNLLDGLDGLAAGAALIGSIAMGAASLFLPVGGDVPVLLGALGGACLGFLPYNRHPASLFMGDSGSLLLGYVLACASVLGLFKLYTAAAFASPLLVLALPLSDTAFSVLRRLRRGESPLKADMGHIHHRLLALGLSQTQAVSLLHGVSLLLGMCAVLTAAGAAARCWLLLSAPAAVLALYAAAALRCRRK